MSVLSCTVAFTFAFAFAFTLHMETVLVTSCMDMGSFILYTTIYSVLYKFELNEINKGFIKEDIVLI